MKEEENKLNFNKPDNKTKMKNGGKNCCGSQRIEVLVKSGNYVLLSVHYILLYYICI